MINIITILGKSSTIIIGVMFFLISLYPTIHPGVMMVSVFITMAMIYLYNRIKLNPTKSKAVFLLLTSLFLMSAQYDFGYYWNDHSFSYLLLHLGGLGYFLTAILTFFLSSKKKNQNVEIADSDSQVVLNNDDTV